jgi:hypothetical protein
VVVTRLAAQLVRTNFHRAESFRGQCSGDPERNAGKSVPASGVLVSRRSLVGRAARKPRLGDSFEPGSWFRTTPDGAF